MDKFLSVVNEDPSTGEIDGKKLKLFLCMVKAWDYAKISKQECQNLFKDEQSSLLKLYYGDMLIRFGEEGKLFCYFCLALAVALDFVLALALVKFCILTFYDIVWLCFFCCFRQFIWKKWYKRARGDQSNIPNQESFWGQ